MGLKEQWLKLLRIITGKKQKGLPGPKEQTSQRGKSDYKSKLVPEKVDTTRSDKLIREQLMQNILKEAGLNSGILSNPVARETLLKELEQFSVPGKIITIGKEVTIEDYNVEKIERTSQESMQFLVESLKREWKIDRYTVDIPNESDKQVLEKGVESKSSHVIYSYDEPNVSITKVTDSKIVKSDEDRGEYNYYTVKENETATFNPDGIEIKREYNRTQDNSDKYLEENPESNQVEKKYYTVERATIDKALRTDVNGQQYVIDLTKCKDWDGNICDIASLKGATGDYTPEKLKNILYQERINGYSEGSPFENLHPEELKRTQDVLELIRESKYSKGCRDYATNKGERNIN